MPLSEILLHHTTTWHINKTCLTSTNCGKGQIYIYIYVYVQLDRQVTFCLYELSYSLTLSCIFFSLHRNLLYSLPGKTSQFSILRFSQEAILHCNVSSKAVKHNSADKEVLCHSTMNQSLSLILRAIRSAERLVCFGLDLFENYPNDSIWSWLTQTHRWAWMHSRAKTATDQVKVKIHCKYSNTIDPPTDLIQNTCSLYYSPGKIAN